MCPKPEDDSEDVTEEETEEGEDSDGGEDRAALALDTPEPAQALAADQMLRKTKARPGVARKGRARGEAGTAGRGVDVVIDDALAGMADGHDAAERDDAFDRDEITDPVRDVHETELLGLLAGLTEERPWENPDLSPVERAAMKEGYERQSAARRTEAMQEDGRMRPKSSAVAAAVVATGVMAATALAKNKDDAASQSATTARGRPQSSGGKAHHNRNAVGGAGASERVPVSAGQRNSMAVRPPLAPSPLAARPEDMSAQQARAQQRRGRQPLAEDAHGHDNDVLEMQAMSRPAGGGEGFGSSPDDDPDSRLHRILALIYLNLGPERVADVPEDRRAGWDAKRLEQKENSLAVTRPPETVQASAPGPSRDMQINFGPGGAG